MKRKNISDTPSGSAARVHLIFALLLLFIGFCLIIQGIRSDLLILQYIGLATWVVAKTPLDNHRFLKRIRLHDTVEQGR